MKPIISLFLAAVVSPLWGANMCQPQESVVIDSEVRCVDSGGISIGYTGDDGVKVACMQDRRVQGTCGPDGSLTRLRAYTTWFNKLKEFEDQCLTEGGTFSFHDPNFVEPQNESYCLQAVPEVGSNMFEEPLCNYRSVCPAVSVTCSRPCADHTFAKRF